MATLEILNSCDQFSKAWKMGMLFQNKVPQNKRLIFYYLSFVALLKPATSLIAKESFL